MIVCVLFIWGSLIYLNSLHGPFLFDDLPFIVFNPDIKNIFDINAIWQASELGRPSRFLSFFSFALNYHFHRLDVFAYHVVNLMVHLVNSFLVYWMSRLIFFSPRLKGWKIAEDRGWISFWASVLFLVHPVQTEAVSYITQRFASLATMFYLGSVCFYMKGRITSHGKATYFLFSAIAAVFSMFTKETALTLPFAVILVEMCFFPGRNLTRWWWVGLPFICVIPAMFGFDAMRILSIEHASSGSHVGDLINWKSYLLTQFRVVLTYIRILLFPFNQNLLYDFPVSKGLLEPKTLLSFLSLLSVFYFGIRIFSRHVLISFGIFWFFLTLLVESSVIPIRHVIFEHRVYLPSVGFFIGFVSALFIGLKHRTLRVTLIFTMAVIFSFLTFQRNKVWQDDILLWSDVVKKSPGQLKGYLNLGVAYTERGQFDQAVETYSRLLEMAVNAEAFGNRGNVYNRMGQYDLAIQDYKKALAIKPQSSQIHSNRGDAYFGLGRYDLAMEDYNQAIQLNPKYVAAYVGRALVHQKMGHDDLAIKDFDAATEINPHLIDPYNSKGALYYSKGQYHMASENYAKVIHINPGYVNAYINRAACHSQLGLLEAALSDYDKARELDWDNGQIYYNRGIVLQKMGQAEKAREDFKMAEAMGYQAK